MNARSNNGTVRRRSPLEAHDLRLGRVLAPYVVQLASGSLIGQRTKRRMGKGSDVEIETVCVRSKLVAWD